MNKILFFAGALFCASTTFAATIFVTPGTQTVNVGSSVNIDVNLSGLGNGVTPSVGTYDLDVNFDSALLSFSSVTWGTGLDVLALGSIQFATPGTGTVNLFELSLDSVSDLNSLQLPTFRLFTLSFTTLAAGTSPVTISVNALGDADGVALPFNAIDGSLTIQETGGSPVPEPSTFLPIAIVLLGFGVRFRSGLCGRTIQD